MRFSSALTIVTGVIIAGAFVFPGFAAESSKSPDWRSDNRFRILLDVDVRAKKRSCSPAAVQVDFQRLLGDRGRFDDSTLEIVSLDEAGMPKPFDAAGPAAQRCRVPYRLDRLFGAGSATLNFVVRDETHTRLAVYFDTVESRRGKPDRYPGLIGDGDRFSELFGRREIGASHFDQFVDIDGDGDLDLFKGGVEPFVYCFENVGENRLIDRGRLSSAGKLLVLPCSSDKRSWVTVAFADWDGDGDQGFLPSFNDGPDRGTIVLFHNDTRQRGGELTFTRVGPLKTVSGAPLAAGDQAGGWFPSITPIDWNGDGLLDALVGSNHHCYWYRNVGPDSAGQPQLADAVPIEADSKPITLVNPRFDCADVDGDGDLDLFAGTQPGPIHFFRNIGSPREPVLAGSVVVAYDGKYLIGDAHSGVKVADFNGDRLLDLVAGRFWERTDLDQLDQPRDYGGLFANVGTPAEPRFKRTSTRSPSTEQSQICDAVRQNGVRAVDWNRDGQTDLLAGDTDGFVWLFRNQSIPQFALFSPGERLMSAGKPLTLAATGGHARIAACDWNRDGALDLLAADGAGTLTLLLGKSDAPAPTLSAGTKILAAGQPVQRASRSSVLVCDWNNDRKQDVVMADSDGYWFYENIGTDHLPVLAAAKPILFGAKPVRYVRPNLGSFVDWDGDGRRDLIGCNFENSVRFYRNVNPNVAGEIPQFESPEGVTILQASSPQMISGADAVDWNGDGDLDILTGQGHGGSGLRFFDRDWIEDHLHNTHPRVTVGELEIKLNP